MDKIILKNISLTGKPLEATFLPGGGMNLISYCLGDKEVIDQKTAPLYQERMAGLGALIGPHFHHSQKKSLQSDPSLLSHGIARYVPWKYSASDTQIKARLLGSDLFKGTPLSEYEGFDFKMTFEARLLDTGLFIEYKVDGASPSVIGLHYYYSLPGKGIVHGEVEPTYRDNDEWKTLPEEWTNGKGSHLRFTLPQEADFGFIPAKKNPNDHDFGIILDSDKYSLHIDFNTSSEKEVSYQIYHPQNSSYVCIEPLSARCPRIPKLSQNTLEVKLEIFSPLH